MPQSDSTRVIAVVRRMVLALLCSLSISTIRADEPVRLTDDGQWKRDATFVEHGRAIVFVLQERPTQLRLMKLTLESRELVALHKDVTKSEFEASFSSDDRYGAFIQSQGNLRLALIIRDYQEKRDAVVPPAGGFSGLRSPVIAPNGKSVVYAFPDGGNQHLFRVNLQAKERKTLTSGVGVNNWPCYSTDGNRLYFSSTRDGNYEIYSMLAEDGGDVRRLTDHRRQDIRPHIGSSQRVAFTSARDGNYEVYLMNADGSNLSRLTRHSERDDYPSWHPDGEQLLVISERDGQVDLYLHTVPSQPTVAGRTP